jgi:hypothetical protein
VANLQLPANYKLFLTDLYLNTVTPITYGVEYNFDITSDSLSQGENRFQLNGVIIPDTTNTPIVTTAVTPVVPEVASAMKVTMLPNPATTQTTISFEAAQKGSASVSIMSVSGQEVYSEVLGEVTSGKVSVPLQNLPAGMYMVRIACGTEVINQKLIKE